MFKLYSRECIHGAKAADNFQDHLPSVEREVLESFIDWAKQKLEKARVLLIAEYRHALTALELHTSTALTCTPRRHMSDNGTTPKLLTAQTAGTPVTHDFVCVSWAQTA